MLASGYCGEVGFVNAWLGFAVGMAGWGFILFEIFMGEACSVAADGDKVSVHVKIAFCLAIWAAAKTDTREKLTKDALLA